MKIYNTIVPVIANIRAEDEHDAVRRLAALLDKAGFETYEWEDLENTRQSFEAEHGTIADA